jgi:hypothetical protein
MYNNNNNKRAMVVVRRQANRETGSQNKKLKDRTDHLRSLMTPTIPKSLRRNNPFPPAMERNLQFQFNGFLLNNAANFIVKEFRINSAFSPDGVGTPSGFNEMAAIYNFYKVLSNKCYYRVAANEPSVPVQFGLIFRDAQPSTVITTYNAAINAVEVAPSTGINLIGETTGMSVYRSPEYKIDPGSIVGNRLEYFGDEDYKGLVTGNPNQAVWCAFVLISASPATLLTNGAFLEIFITLDTLFYSLKVTEQ